MLKATVILFDTRIPEKDFLFYYIPKELENKISVGKGVIVPLKRRRVLGYVWNLNYYNSTDDLSLNIKPIISVVDKFPSLPESLIKVVNWISEYYENSLYKSANYIFPSGVELKIKRKLKAIDNFNGDLTKKQREIFEQLKKEEKILKKGISENIIRNLIKKGAIEEDIDVEISEKHPKKEYFYNPIRKDWDIKREISIEFQKIKEKLNSSHIFFIENRKERWELYLEIIKYFYNNGKQILITFPTINSLNEFIEFALNKIPIKIYYYHGLLTPAQSYQIFKISGEKNPILIVSTGKGIFLPLHNLGIIIMDEEENEFYNYREKEPRFDIWNVVKKRGELENIPIIFGTSSPSVITFYNFINGKIKLYRKVSQKAKITVIDRRGKKDEILSSYSLRRVKEVLKQGKQVFLLLNRLGYATYLQCQDCGYTFYCPYCSTSLVYYSEELELRCHYCGYKTPSITTCPKCGGYSFIYGGMGTERLENYLRRNFRNYIIQRWDSDLEVKDETLLYKSNIIVGTRLIVPWISKLSVGLLVIVNFDNFLHIPDFSISEKTFNLIRRILSDFSGEEIIIQTYSPNHYILKALKFNSYSLFLHEELKVRKELNYPPYSKIHQILIIGEDEEEVREIGKEIKERLEKFCGIDILGPAPYFPLIVKEKYRYQILIKVLSNEDINEKLKDIVKTEDIFSNYKVIINKDIKEIIP